VTITAPPDLDLSDPNILRHLAISYHDRPASEAYYDDPDFNRILHAYLGRGEDTAVVFPIGALRTVRYFRELSAGRLLLLSGDKGYSREEDLPARGRPGLALHGSLSLMVNYHAIAQYILHQGGRVLHPAHRPSSLTVVAYLLGQRPTGYGEATLAYSQAIEQGGPDDFFSLKKAIEPYYAALSLEQILADLRLSGWDSNIFRGCLPRVHQILDGLSASERQGLCRAIRQRWAAYYPLSEDQDLAFELGILLSRLGYDAEALWYFQHSLRLFGPRRVPPTTWQCASIGWGTLQRPWRISTGLWHGIRRSARPRSCGAPSNRASIAKKNP
jgi:hypothetical protein